MLAGGAAERDAVQAGHQPVDHDRVGLRGGGARQAGAAVVGGLDLEADVGQRVFAAARASTGRPRRRGRGRAAPSTVREIPHTGYRRRVSGGGSPTRGSEPRSRRCRACGRTRRASRGARCWSGSVHGGGVLPLARISWSSSRQAVAREQPVGQQHASSRVAARRLDGRLVAVAAVADRDPPAARPVGRAGTRGSRAPRGARAGRRAGSRSSRLQSLRHRGAVARRGPGRG